VSRSSDLLKAAADYLDDGGNPLELLFLSENEVTFDECGDLADSLAMGARLVAWAMEHPREAAAFLSNGSAGMALDACTRAMAGINLSASPS
jgi:hypothetical protein